MRPAAESEYRILENALIYRLFLWWRAASAKGRSALGPAIGAAIAGCAIALVYELIRSPGNGDLVRDAVVLTFACIGIAVVAIVAGPAIDWYRRSHPGVTTPKAH